MTTDPAPVLEEPAAPFDAGVRRVLVRGRRAPARAAEACVDVRPHGVATYDGDRIRLSLLVSVGDRGARLSWIDRPAIDGTVGSMIDWADASFVRFGDRAHVDHALEPAGAAVLERVLAAAANRAGVPLVSWTVEAPPAVDTGPYDLVVDQVA